MKEKEWLRDKSSLIRVNTFAFRYTNVSDTSLSGMIYDNLSAPLSP